MEKMFLVDKNFFLTNEFVDFKKNNNKLILAPKYKNGCTPFHLENVEYSLYQQNSDDSKANEGGDDAKANQVGDIDMSMEDEPKLKGESFQLKLKDNPIKCCICLFHIKEMSPIITVKKCKHVLHAKCGDALFSKSTKCPMCRKSLLDKKYF